MGDFGAKTAQRIPYRPGAVDQGRGSRTPTERVRHRVMRRCRMQRHFDADAAADMRARENSGVAADASVRITFLDRDVPSYFHSLEHLLRHCARPPFARERLSVTRVASGRITRVRYALPQRSGMRATTAPREAAVTRMKSPARTSRRGLCGPR